MPEDLLIPTPAPSDVPSFKILVETKEINSAYRVMNLSVTKEFNKITHAEINLLDGSVSKEDFNVSNTDDFIIGKNVEIQAGYHGQNSTIFKGIIIKHGIKILENKGSSLNIILKILLIKALWLEIILFLMINPIVILLRKSLINMALKRMLTALV